MKKIVFFSAVFLMIAYLFAQELQYEAVAINVEVPVRVFKGSQFIDHLMRDDFEVYEEGIPQKIEAVYLIKKREIAREDTASERDRARNRYDPQVTRNFVLVFEITDYLPRIKEAVAFFFEKVISAGDTLTVITPTRTYQFNRKALLDFPRDKISTLLNEKLREDITTGCMEYHSMLRDYKNLMDSDFSGSEKLYLIRQKIREFRQLRDLNEKRIRVFSEHLKNMFGQKLVFLFYQRELLPFPEVPFETFEQLELTSELMTLLPQNIDNIKQSFSDSSITINFLYITEPQREIAADYHSRQQGVLWEDISAGIFNTFFEMAQSTGGLIESSANIAFAFEKAAEASENYYLLYYSPKNYSSNGKFREIKVKVKGQNFRVTHRAGYFAD